MSDVSDLINRISYDASQAYVLSRSDLNNFIKCAASEHNLNPEMIKRVCEKANQNVYLGLFKDPATDRANIQFKLADFEQITGELKNEESAMNDYVSAPADYRMGETKIASADGFESSDADNAREKHEIMQKIAFARDNVTLLRRAMETVKVASQREAEIEFGKMHEMCRSMVISGESLGDISKIACTAISAKGIEFMKTAEAFAYIGGALEAEGLKVSDEFTKISSVPAINHDHPMNRASFLYAEHIEKSAAAESVIDGIEAHLTQLNNLLEAAAAL